MLESCVKREGVSLLLIVVILTLGFPTAVDAGDNEYDNQNNQNDSTDLHMRLPPKNIFKKLTAGLKKLTISLL